MSTASPAERLEQEEEEGDYDNFRTFLRSRVRELEADVLARFAVELAASSGPGPGPRLGAGEAFLASTASRLQDCRADLDRCPRPVARTDSEDGEVLLFDPMEEGSDPLDLPRKGHGQSPPPQRPELGCAKLKQHRLPRPDPTRPEAVQWIMLAYWIVDVLVNFSTGVYRDGIVMMNPGLIAQHYLRGWFFVDMAILSVDMTSCIMIAENDGDNTLMKIFRSPRMWRATRLLRLFRFRRLLEVATRVTDSCESELSLAIVRIVSLVGGILVLNHFIACIWYAVGMSYEGEDTKCWLSDQSFESKAHAYVSAFHWSLTQFTPATQNLAPVTPFERLCAIVVVLIALVTFSTFLGKMTSAMTQLLALNARSYKQEVMLRRFLAENKISAKLAQSVWHVFRQQQQSAAKQQKTTLTQMYQNFSVPMNLQVSLCHETHQKYIIALPILRKVMKVQRNQALARSICFILAERSAIPGQEVFSAGEVARSTLCLTQGRMTYSSKWLCEPVELLPSEWVSEAVLWGDWKRRGVLIAGSACRWVDMDASRFRAVCLQHCDDKTRKCFSHYAELFEAEAVELDIALLDICVDESDFEARTRMTDAAGSLLNIFQLDQDEHRSFGFFSGAGPLVQLRSSHEQSRHQSCEGGVSHRHSNASNGTMRCIPSGDGGRKGSKLPVWEAEANAL